MELITGSIPTTGELLKSADVPIEMPALCRSRVSPTELNSSLLTPGGLRFVSVINPSFAELITLSIPPTGVFPEPAVADVSAEVPPKCPPSVGQRFSTLTGRGRLPISPVFEHGSIVFPSRRYHDGRNIIHLFSLTAARP